MKTIDGKRIGALWDLCSTNNYITFCKAEKLGLKGQDVILTVEGKAGVEETSVTKLFTKKGKRRVYQCYCLETIAIDQEICLISSQDKSLVG